MSPIDNLELLLRELPGIGPRQAKRFVYFLLKQDPRYLDSLSKLIASIKTDTVSCAACRRFFSRKEGAQNTCHICLDESRDRSTLMVVPTDADFLRIEESGVFKGLYFVLGGNISVTAKEPEKNIRSTELLRRVEVLSPALNEIILVSDMTPDGEATNEAIHDILKHGKSSKDKKISVLGRGLSTGSEIEYADTDTLKNALVNRKML